MSFQRPTGPNGVKKETALVTGKEVSEGASGCSNEFGSRQVEDTEGKGSHVTETPLPVIAEESGSSRKVPGAEYFKKGNRQNCSRVLNANSWKNSRTGD